MGMKLCARWVWGITMESGWVWEQFVGMEWALCLSVQHDSTVAPFLSAMNVFNNISPPYTATVLVELFNSSGQFSVKVLYRNDSVRHPEAYPMTIPGTFYASSTCTS